MSRRLRSIKLTCWPQSSNGEVRPKILWSEGPNLSGRIQGVTTTKRDMLRRPRKWHREAGDLWRTSGTAWRSLWLGDTKTERLLIDFGWIEYHLDLLIRGNIGTVNYLLGTPRHQSLLPPHVPFCFLHPHLLFSQYLLYPLIIHLLFATIILLSSGLVINSPQLLCVL